jgi:hypothetical protein
MTTTILGLILALVLVVPVLAEADCAWGLWVNEKYEPAGWRLVSSAPAWYSSKNDCMSTATYQRAHTPSQPGDVMCLPQGVEPMGKTGSYEYRPWRGAPR